MIKFTVPGRAQPAGSKRAFVRNGRPIIVDANPASGAWKERVAIAAAQARGSTPPLSGPIKFCLHVTLLRPQGHWKKSGGLSRSAPAWPVVRPDLLKLARACEDACTGVLYEDDSQIVDEQLIKTYGDRDEATITVSSLTNGTAPGL
jgi:Holliday junction resolvase RusA-like endonuclease